MQETSNKANSDINSPKSGNYFGWKFSFFGLGAIILTLIASVLLETDDIEQHKTQPYQKPIQDTIQVERNQNDN